MFNRERISGFLSFSSSAFVHAFGLIALTFLDVVPAGDAATKMVVVSAMKPEEPLQELVELQELKIEPLELDLKDVETTSPDSSLADSLADREVGAFEFAAAESLDGPMLTDDMLASLGAEVGSGSGGGSLLFGMTEVRGSSTGQSLLGTFYDLKQDPKRMPLPYSGAFPEYVAIVNRLAAAGFSEKATGAYFQASTRLALSQLMIPANTPATDAPKEFRVEGLVEPRGWMVHYTGTVIPPRNGQWRFVGFFDDLLIVYVNNRPVLDGSWVPMCNVGMGPYDDSLRQEFGGPSVSGVRTAYAGKWFDVKGPTKIDILVGETPGGLVGGLLMCQQRGVDYPLRPDGTPVLPLFATSSAASARVQAAPYAQKYRILPDPPIWKLQEKKGR